MPCLIYLGSCYVSISLSPPNTKLPRIGGLWCVLAPQHLWVLHVSIWSHMSVPPAAVGDDTMPNTAAEASKKINRKVGSPAEVFPSLPFPAPHADCGALLSAERLAARRRSSAFSSSSRAAGGVVEVFDVLLSFPRCCGYGRCRCAHRRG